MLIGGFQPFSLSDFPGKTAAIIFTQGCNFRCPYCHNRPLWPLFSGSATSPDAVFERLKKRAGQLEGVVITGGEPTLQADLETFIQSVKELGFAVKLDTNGSHPHVIQKLTTKNLLDFIAMDIKAPSEKYSLLAGTDIDFAMIDQTIRMLQKGSVPHLFRTTYDAGLLDQNDLESIKDMLHGSPHVVQECRPVP